jgi:prepilin-type N-terminal cleavage/methylation domain-containing protein
MKKNGFTLVEVIAVVVILGILVTFASPYVIKYIDSSKESTKQQSLKDTEDAAISYGLTQFIPESCAVSSKVTKPSDIPSGCDYSVTIQELIDKQLLKDTAKVLDRNAKVYIYKLRTTNEIKTSYEVKAYVSEDIYIG